jgi:hypothetical protein
MFLSDCKRSKFASEMRAVTGGRLDVRQNVLGIAAFPKNATAGYRLEGRYHILKWDG